MVFRSIRPKIGAMLALLNSISYRQLTALGFIGCVSAMGFALVLQHVFGLDPCPLCVLQRIGVVGAGLFFLAAAVHNPDTLGRRVYSILAYIPIFAGGGVAARHSWLQHLPADQVPSCGPGFDFIVGAFPMADALNMILKGSGECADQMASFLGLSIPEWTLIVFVGFFIYNSYTLMTAAIRR